MGFGIGGGIGPLRASVSNRGIGGGIGPLFAGTSWHSRRGSSSAAGGLLGLVLIVAGVAFIAIWPYLLGTWLAVRLGAGPASAVRSVVGWTFEVLYLALAVWIAVSVALDRLAARRRAAQDCAAKNETLRREMSDRLKRHPDGVPGAGLPSSERLLVEVPGVYLIEPRSEHRGGPKAPTVVGEGTAVFSDTALRFVGDKTVTWKWANLLKATAGRDYLTFAVSNRQMNSGIGASAGEQWALELATRWACAVHDGEPLDEIRAAPELRSTADSSPPDVLPATIDVGDGGNQDLPPIGPSTPTPLLTPPAVAVPHRKNALRAAATTQTATEPATDELTEHVAWDTTVPLPSPATATASQVQDAIMQIITAEGPVLQQRAFALYGRSAGATRVGAKMRRILEFAADTLVADGVLSADDPLSEDTPSARTLRLVDHPRVVLRTRGQRTLHDIPPSEISALVGRLRRDGDEEEVWQRRILNTYGLARLTESTRARLRSCSRLADTG